MAIVFTHDGECYYSGSLASLTTSTGFNANYFEAPQWGGMTATHRIPYNAAATAALVVGEELTGGTSTSTCKLIAKAIDNGATAGTLDAGWLWVSNLSAVFTSTGEVLTGTATGTVVGLCAPILEIPQTIPKAALLTVETADIRFTMGGTPAGVTSGSGIGHLVTVGQSFVVRGWNNILRLKMINAVASSGAVVKYSLFY